MDKYANFAELASKEIEDVDYRIELKCRPASRTTVIAPHGGGIERGTARIARAVAGDDLSFYLFEGIKPNGNKVLHITSHRFDEPGCLALGAGADTVVAIHGCSVPKSGIRVGGLDSALRQALCSELKRGGLPVVAEGHEFPAAHPTNICNRGARRCGAQLEISRDLRCTPYWRQIAVAVRRAVDTHNELLQPTHERTARG